MLLQSIKTISNRIFSSAMLSGAREYCTRFLPVQCCPKSIKTTMNLWFFPVHAVMCGACTKFLPEQCCPKSIKTTLNRIFSYEMLSGDSWDSQSFYLCNVVPRVLRQHWIRFVPVQCCPKSIKTTLGRIFSCAMLSEASWTTLHKILTYAMLSQEY